LQSLIRAGKTTTATWLKTRSLSTFASAAS
jgi:hypothetical protein